MAADWNVVVTLPEATFCEARKLLRRWGEVHRTGYFHVLTLTVEDIESFLAEVAKAIEEKPGTFNILSHIIPAQRTFTFTVPRISRRRRATSRSCGRQCSPAKAFMSGCTGAGSKVRCRYRRKNAF